MPAYCRSAVCARRSADDEKRKKRRTKRCDSALSERAVRSPNCCWTNAVRGCSSRSAIVMLSRVVDQDAEEILLRNGRLQDQRGAEQAEHAATAMSARRSADEHRAIARRAIRRDAAVGHERGRGERRQAEEAERHRPRGREREIPLVEDERRILEEELETASPLRAILLKSQAPRLTSRAAKKIEIFDPE